MGYTHYWTTTTELPAIAFQAFFADVVKLFALPEVKGLLAYESDSTRAPLADNDQVQFNGRGEQSHETFIFTRGPQDTFCKTAYKPYDVAVVAVLLLAKRHFKGLISVWSDGDRDGADWAPGRALAAQIKSK